MYKAYDIDNKPGNINSINDCPLEITCNYLTREYYGVFIYDRGK